MKNNQQVQDDPIFADGFSFKRKPNAPDFVVGSMSVKVDDAIAFLNANKKKGWVNIDVKTAKSGNIYMQLDTWEPTPKVEEQQTAEGGDGLPF
jgi:hypothetical protein|tara:strand:- start:342 stop:620 length:279 start_codon:yes stop_codon:yes gene_type:complete